MTWAILDVLLEHSLDVLFPRCEDSRRGSHLLCTFKNSSCSRQTRDRRLPNDSNKKI